MTAASIFLAGDFAFDRLGASYQRAFSAIGYQVDTFDLSKATSGLAWPGRNRVLHRLTIRSQAARRLWSRRLNLDLLAAAARSAAHWVLMFNGEWVMPETIAALKRQGKRVAIFHADNPFPPNYANRPETLADAREADLYLIWSERLVHRLLAAGVKRAAFMPFGWDPLVFPYQGAIPQGSWPGVLFVGGWDREREAFLDEVAAHVPLRIYGPSYWGTRTRLGSRARACWQGRALSMADAAQAIRESAVCLNVLRTQHIVDGEFDGVIMRHFEVPGAGGFLLSTRSGGATKLFPASGSGAFFSDVRDCIEKCKNYTQDEEGRKSVQERSHASVSTAHTYECRASEIVALMRRSQ